jgi:hypothetical protein
MGTVYKTKGKLFQWTAESGVSWYFVHVDKEVSGLIREKKHSRIAFGSVRVQATLGQSVWNTSLFPHKIGGVYMLPIKASIRSKEDIYVGDEVQLQLVIL